MRPLNHRMLQSGSRVTNDVERFVVGWRLEIQSDGVELRLRRPRSAGRQVLRSILQLTLAQFVRRVDEVQLVRDIRALEHLPEPGPLRPGVAGEVENDRHPLRQHGANVRRYGMSQARRAVQDTGHIGDLTRKEALEEFVLDEEDGMAAVGEISRE